MDEVSLTPVDMRLGEEKNLRIVITDNETGQDLSAATSTITIYDSAGTATLAETSCSETGTDRLVCSYFLTSGSGKTLTTAGTYRVVWKVVFNSVKRKWQQQLNLYGSPSS